MKATEHRSPARERILDRACDLFYRQGYRATGINQVIAESGVAKATFYTYFPSKDDLLIAYVREMSRREIGELREHVWAFPTARDRLFGPLKILRPWFESTNFRGCPFQNAASEVPPDMDRVHKILSTHRKHERDMLAELFEEFIAEAAPGAQCDTEALAETYLLLFEGAIALASSCREYWPVERAEKTLAELIDASIVA